MDNTEELDGILSQLGRGKGLFSISSGVSAKARVQEILARQEIEAPPTKNQYKQQDQQAGDLNQSGTKYYNPNYVYNMSSTDMVLGAKNAPKGLSTMGGATRADAMEVGKAWVGPGAKPITNGNGEIVTAIRTR